MRQMLTCARRSHPFPNWLSAQHLSPERLQCTQGETGMQPISKDFSRTFVSPCHLVLQPPRLRNGFLW